MACVRMNKALKHVVSKALQQINKTGDQVLAWRENIVNSKNGEWTGPFEVEEIDKAAKLAYIRDTTNSPDRTFNVAQVKPYYAPDNLAFVLIAEVFDYFKQHWSPSNEEEIFATEIISNNEARSPPQVMNEAKRKEVRCLLKRRTFKTVLKEDFSADGNGIPGHFVLTIKPNLAGKIKHKASFYVGVHQDKLKDLMVYSIQTLQAQSICLLLAIYVSYEFVIWTTDLREAYLQPSIFLLREGFVEKNN